MITQDEIAWIIAQYVGHRPFEDMAEDRDDLRGKIRDGFDVNEPTRDDCREAAADILTRLSAVDQSPEVGKLIDAFNRWTPPPTDGGVK